MVDYSDEPVAVQNGSPQPEHIQIGENEDESVADKLNYAPSSDFKKPWQRQKFIGGAIKTLIQQNFTRNVTIVVDEGVGTFPKGLKYVHMRAKMDTGCNDNLVTMNTVQKACIDRSLLLDIPESEKVDLHGLENAECTPLYQIKLKWYQDGDMEMRDSRFYVIQDGPFDMLLGSGRIAQDLDDHGNPSLILAKRKKAKGLSFSPFNDALGVWLISI